MYKLYAQNKKGIWKEIDKSNKLEQIQISVDKITPKQYYKYMIKEENKIGDNIIEIKDLYKECKVEFKDEIKTDFKVKGTIFKPSKMKQKEEFRKMTEEYIR